MTARADQSPDVSTGSESSPSASTSGKPQSKVDNVNVIAETVATTIGTERAEDAESRHVEVVCDEYLINAGGEAVQQKACGRRGQVLSRLAPFAPECARRELL